jgi:hypothetical protein
MKVSSPRIAAVVAAASLAGGGIGAGAYAFFHSSSGTTTTVVRQVKVTQSLQAADKSGSALSVGSIYKLAQKAVVKITVTSNGSSSSPFNQGTQRSQAPVSARARTPSSTRAAARPSYAR